MRGFVIKDQHLADLAQSLRYFLEYGERRVQFRFLRHVSQPQRGCAPDSAIIRPRFARENAQQARLAAAVSADQADTLRGVELQVYMVKQRMMAEGEAAIFNSKERHWQKLN